MRLICNDGTAFIGPSHTSIVRQMKASSWGAGDTKVPYMESVVTRISEMTMRPRPERPLTTKEFLDYLIEVGVVQLDVRP